MSVSLTDVLLVVADVFLGLLVVGWWRRAP